MQGYQGLVTADRMSRRRPRSGAFPQQISHSVMPQLQRDMAGHEVPVEDGRHPQLQRCSACDTTFISMETAHL